MSARTARKSSLASAREIVAVKMEGDGVGRFGPRLLREPRSVEHQQKRALLGGVEHDRQQHTVVLPASRRRWHEHRLSGIKARYVPSAYRAGFRIDLDDRV